MSSLDESWNPHCWVNHKSLAEHGWEKWRIDEEHEERKEHLREFENFYFDPQNNKNVNESMFVVAIFLKVNLKMEMGPNNGSAQNENKIKVGFSYKIRAQIKSI